MTQNYEHYITKGIRSVYSKRIIAPVLYLILLLVLWCILPISDLLFPTSITSYKELKQMYEEGNIYIQASLNNLHFTGFTNTRFHKTIGYFYYTMMDDTCIFVLLTPQTCEEGLPIIPSATIKGRVLFQGKAYKQMTEKLSKDLSWTAKSLQEKASPYILSEPDVHSYLSTFGTTLYLASGVFALCDILLCISYILFPLLSPPCRKLGRFGKPTQLLSQAEEELATLPQLATEDMFITKHFFITITDSGVAIVPIREILWIYKYSTRHKFLWHIFNISYTLHITTTHRGYLQCPKNVKSDIDGIIDYLAEANHNIIVGFNEQNRLLAQRIETDRTNKNPPGYVFPEKKEEQPKD